MRKAFNIMVLSLVFVIALPILAHAQSATFEVSLKYGMENSPEVIKLQNFLVGQGVLQSSFVTGNYFSLTQKAVVDFQKSQGIDATGYFGPLSRAAANKIVLAKGGSSGAASISSISIQNANSGAASVFLSNEKVINWRSSDYPSGKGVNINLIRKVSDSPKSFVLVKTIAANTPNDGQERWTPGSKETTDDLYVEITCTAEALAQGCKTIGEPAKVK